MERMHFTTTLEQFKEEFERMRIRVDYLEGLVKIHEDGCTFYKKLLKEAFELNNDTLKLLRDKNGRTENNITQDS